jgi:hypothetical protein
VHSPLNGNPAAAIAVRPKQDTNLRIIKMGYEIDYVDLDSQHFYEVCQKYRHADDFSGDAARAFEELKEFIREHVKQVSAKD